MKSFLLRLSIFIIPIGILFIIPLSALILAREFFDIETVVDAQLQSPKDVLVNFAYGNYTKRYKTLGVIKANPEVIVLGTSRVMQFRSLFFKGPSMFYNAGGMDNASDLAPFLQKVSKADHLRVVLVGIDARYLLHKAAASVTDEKVTMREQLQIFLRSSWRMVYKDYVSGKFSGFELYKKYKTSSNIGLTALIKEKGFRHDGSFDYGKDVLTDPSRLGNLEEAIAERLLDISSGGRGIGYDSSISSEHLMDVEKFLQQAKEQNIYVIGFLPPSPTPLIQSMQTLPDERGDTFRELPETLKLLFEKYQYHFYDTSLLGTIGSAEKEMIDIEHGGEKATLRLLLYLTEHEPILREYVTPTILEPLLLKGSDVEVF